MHINKQEILIYHDNWEIDAKNYCSGCVVRSEHLIDILNVNLIEKEHLNVFITKSFIEKMVSFWDSVKKFNKGATSGGQ